MKRYLILILTFNLLLFSQEKPVLRWAADTESGAPFVFSDPKIPSKLIGFEVDIINAIAQEIDYSTEFVQNEWDGLIPGLQRGDYDIAINGLEITADRANQVNFSVPYYITYEVLAVRATEPDINTLSDLSGKKAGTLGGTLAERILNDIGGVDVRTYGSEANSYEDLKNGRIDAVLIDQPVALYYASWQPEFRLIEKPFGEVVYGIVVDESQPELLDKINNAISNLATTGKLREIYENWGLWNEYMATHFNDFSKSTSEPTRFEDYKKFRKKEKTFADRLQIYLDVLPVFGIGALKTLQISILAMILAIISGLTLALLKVYGSRPLSWISSAIIEIIRGTPLLIQLILIFYGLPQLGISIEPVVAAVIGLGLNYGAYEAENYRAGLFSVPRGQLEAAISLGMTKTQALRYVIVPQAVRIVIPPVTNDFISLLKDSSIVSIITMRELTYYYQNTASTYFDYIGLGLICAAVYFLIGLPFVKLSKTVEQRFSIGKKSREIS